MTWTRREMGRVGLGAVLAAFAPLRALFGATGAVSGAGRAESGPAEGAPFNTGDNFPGQREFDEKVNELIFGEIVMRDGSVVRGDGGSATWSHGRATKLPESFYRPAKTGTLAIRIPEHPNCRCVMAPVVFTAEQEARDRRLIAEGALCPEKVDAARGALGMDPLRAEDFTTMAHRALRDAFRKAAR